MMNSAVRRASIPRNMRNAASLPTIIVIVDASKLSVQNRKGALSYRSYPNTHVAATTSATYSAIYRVRAVSNNDCPLNSGAQQEIQYYDCFINSVIPLVSYVQGPIEAVPTP